MQETQAAQAESLGWEGPLEEEMANPMDRGAWYAIVHSVAESHARLCIS